jgi:A/G-specific adenine glycosylase
VVPLWTECVSVLSRYFIETDIALASAKRVCSTGFRIDAKDNPATTIMVGCFAMRSKSKLWCLRFNDSCGLQKKESRPAARSKKLKVRNRYFNYLVVSDENENTLKKENR